MDSQSAERNDRVVMRRTSLTREIVAVSRCISRPILLVDGSNTVGRSRETGISSQSVSREQFKILVGEWYSQVP